MKDLGFVRWMSDFGTSGASKALILEQGGDLRVGKSFAKYFGGANHVCATYI